MTLPKQPNKSLIDGVRCLQAVVSREQPVGVSEVGAMLGLETTRVHRLLRTLSHMGFLRQDTSRKFSAGPAIPVLAAQTLHASRLLREAIGPLEALRRETGLIVALGVLWDRSVSYLYHAAPNKRLEDSIGTTRCWEATASGLGIALLARLPVTEVAGRYRGRSIPNYPGGWSDLRAELQRTSKCGYSFISTSDEHSTLALALESNQSAAIGVSGQISPDDIVPLLVRIRETANAIDAAA